MSLLSVSKHQQYKNEELEGGTEEVVHFLIESNYYVSEE